MAKTTNGGKTKRTTAKRSATRKAVERSERVDLYQGINVLILWMRAMKAGFGRQRWMTFAQARQLGGHVRKGEKSVRSSMPALSPPKEDREAAAAERRDEQARRYLKTNRVFNVSQIEGLIDEIVNGPRPPAPSFEGVDARVRRIIQRGRMRFVTESARPSTNPERTWCRFQ